MSERFTSCKELVRNIPEDGFRGSPRRTIPGEISIRWFISGRHAGRYSPGHFLCECLRSQRAAEVGDGIAVSCTKRSRAPFPDHDSARKRGAAEFRRFGGFTAFSEGWGLYAESLGKEIGVYTDPYQYFGGLNAELWRSIRLVVDTGIHCQGVDAAAGAGLHVREFGRCRGACSVRSRALSWPFRGRRWLTRSGSSEIREIRNNAEARLGDKFDVKAFHTEVLRDGAMPLSMLEAKIEQVDRRAMCM